MSTENTIAVESISSIETHVPPRMLPPEHIPDSEMETNSEVLTGDPNSAVFSVQPDWYLSLRHVH